MVNGSKTSVVNERLTSAPLGHGRLRCGKAGDDPALGVESTLL
jgi:hypothetical protein